MYCQTTKYKDNSLERKKNTIPSILIRRYNRINKGAVKKEIPRKMTLHTVYAIPDLTILLLNI